VRAAALLAGLRADRRGTAAVEFALVSVLLVAMMIGVIDAGRLFWVRGSLQYAAEEAGRWAISHPTATAAQIVAVARTRAGEAGSPNADVVATPETAPDGTRFVTVELRDSVPIGQGLLPLRPVPLLGRSRVPL
jgi:Flp pilus assembly protein TadG